MHTHNRRRFLNQTLVSWHLLGLLGIAGIFMPLCRGCSDEVRYPVQVLTRSAPVGEVIAVLLTFSYPLVIASTLLLVYAFASYRLFLGLVILQLTMLIGLLVWFLYQAVIEQSNHPTLPRIATLALGFLPIVLGIPWWLGRPLYRRQWCLIWARLQQLLSLIAWLWLNLLCLFARVYLIGYWYTTLVMVAAALLAQKSSLRMAHDLWNPAQPVVELQFSLRQLFFWMTFFPVLAAYYAAIEPLIDWLFPR